VPLAVARVDPSVAVCRAPARLLVEQPAAVLGEMNSDYLCKAPPLAPTDLHLVANEHGQVTIAWSPTPTRRALHIVEVGRAPRRVRCTGNAPLGRATEFTADGVNAGSYFVRVRGRNGCGAGPASNELVVEVK
jgi:hypothetical protein